VPRLFANGEWFDRVSPSATYEVDLENALLAHAAELYPGFHLVPFKRRVVSPFGGAIADLALIQKDYGRWWVVEVEIGDHPLEGHVVPQVEALANATYGPDEADCLYEKNRKTLDPSRTRDMMLGPMPHVLVIVNQHDPKWAEVLRPLGALVGVVEVFRSSANRAILQLHGEHPVASSEFVTLCEVDRTLQTALRVESPAALAVANQAVVSLRYRDGATQWTRIDAGKHVYLMPQGRFPLPPHIRNVRVCLGADGEFTLEHVERS